MLFRSMSVYTVCDTLTSLFHEEPHGRALRSFCNNPPATSSRSPTPSRLQPSRLPVDQRQSPVQQHGARAAPVRPRRARTRQIRAPDATATSPVRLRAPRTRIRPVMVVVVHRGSGLEGSSGSFFSIVQTPGRVRSTADPRASPRNVAPARLARRSPGRTPLAYSRQEFDVRRSTPRRRPFRAGSGTLARWGSVDLGCSRGVCCRTIGPTGPRLGSSGRTVVAGGLRGQNEDTVSFLRFDESGGCVYLRFGEVRGAE